MGSPGVKEMVACRGRILHFMERNRFSLERTKRTRFEFRKKKPVTKERVIANEKKNEVQPLKKRRTLSNNKKKERDSFCGGGEQTYHSR